MKHIRGGVEPWYVLSMTCGSIPNRWSMKWNMLLAQTQIPTQTQTPQHGAEWLGTTQNGTCVTNTQLQITGHQGGDGWEGTRRRCAPVTFTPTND